MVSVRERLSRNRLGPPVQRRGKVGLGDVAARLEAHEQPFDEELLARVFEFSTAKHGGQKRRSGEPYVTHPIQVAYTLADLGFDATCVAAGLLHDVLEDTLATREELHAEFGEDIADLVEGVTKIGRHEYVRRDQAQAETFRKLILASIKDIRAILVKLADRWHNMATLEHLPAESRRRIARETLEIYAPIARRLGMSRVQGDLEDLAFYHLYPHQFAELQAAVGEKMKVGRRTVEEVRARLAERLEGAGIEAEINYRVKRLYSIHGKLRQRGLDLSQLYDYVAFRIITADVRDCYAALGVVHQTWRPVPGRIKDYIAMPKPNLYQSLHTTLVGEAGRPFEVQIRTREMDRIAEQGIAAHWSYKESTDGAGDPNILWLRQLVEWQKEVKDPRAFMTALKVDLYPDEVYAFTPKGDVLAFPLGATPLDFAYRIHTDLGHQCTGARVNGKLVPLKTSLANGDIVEILTVPGRHPSRDWLKFVRTTRAKSKIRHWLNTEQKRRSTEIGRRSVERALRRHKLSFKRFLELPELAPYLSREGHARIEDLFSAIGFGKVTVKQVLAKILTHEQLATEAAAPGRLRQAVEKILPFGGGAALTVRGHGDLLAYLAKCCAPVPGEEIVGYITRGRGVSVHSVACPNVQNLLYNPEREIEVDWAGKSDDLFPVVLRIDTEDRPGILAQLTEIIARLDSNILQMETDTRETRGTGRASIDVVVEVRDSRHLEKIREAVRESRGVIDVVRPMRG
ncbi:MAG: bifunctional (p)ppGpp synthetase/guanosine-3',5'-bis(diphosphate) 3'-pyrophosphohydrolase [Acidobacteriota bacterium]|nr:bifunctional (p)ppGpp synthetase/guanosine-3',5'-bis(diphosphate) 3'-pyrophosphohydrolase [Acidobacteriota bacterium]MDH3523655.1 bifunctional (p)ppGpp synthetase/guanosine-3',5'-bis(diphosphate) 3'-pyrophosphohydrolase [Acidobacteriota bacterium]